MITNRDRKIYKVLGNEVAHLRMSLEKQVNEIDFKSSVGKRNLLLKIADGFISIDKKITLIK